MLPMIAGLLLGGAICFVGPVLLKLIEFRIEDGDWSGIKHLKFWADGS